MIDDIGSEKVTDWVLETLSYLVNHRYEHLLPVALTSNHTLENSRSA